MRTEPRKLEKEPLNRKIMVHGAMHYQCEACSTIYLMWLEKGIEDSINREKPAPFTIACLCGGLASHICWQADVHLGKYVELSNELNYFGNEEDSECGVSHIRNNGDNSMLIEHPEIGNLFSPSSGNRITELSKYVVEENEDDDPYGLAQFSTSTLKAELRRRKRWK